MRRGTLNVPGMVALGEACSIAKKELFKNAESIGALRDYLETELLKIDGTSVNGNTPLHLFNTSNILFFSADSDAIIMGLSNPVPTIVGTLLIAVSNGSACTSASIEPSHVLTAMGLNEVAAFSCIRFSIGKFNTKKERVIVVDAVKDVVSTLRSMVS